MQRPRLLLVVPAATALVFTGISPAWAGGGDGHDDVWAEIVSIEDEADADDDAERVRVEFTYKCEDDDGVTAKVTLKQDDDVRYEGESDDLECNGEENSEEVELSKEGEDDVENGEARVTVRIRYDDETLDRETESVEVEGVEDDGGGRNGDRNGDDDKARDDNGDDDKGHEEKGH